MRGISIAVGSLLYFTCSLNGQMAWAHGDERLGIEPINESAFSAGAIGYDFQLIDLKEKTILEDSDFLVLHEQKVHIFVYDPALKKLQHTHATFSKDLWHSDLLIPQDGRYWIWAEGRLAIDQSEGYGASRLEIINGDPADTSDPDLNEIRAGSDGTSQVELSDDPIVKEQEVMLMLTYSRTDGSMPDITPYLGEMGHAILVSEDGDWLSHSHVMMDDMGMLMLHAEFPEEGNYRVWIQFMDAGVLKTVSLAVAVGAK